MRARRQEAVCGNVHARTDPRRGARAELERALVEHVARLPECTTLVQLADLRAGVQRLALWASTTGLDASAKVAQALAAVDAAELRARGAA